MNKFDGHRRVLETTRYEYEPLQAMLLVRFSDMSGRAKPGVLSDKVAADMCGTSERMIRNARLGDRDGLIGLNPYLADHCAVVGLGMHPRDIWGDDWVTGESLYAGDIQQGEEVKLSKKERDNPLSAGRALPTDWDEFKKWQEQRKDEIKRIEKARARRAEQKAREAQEDS